MFAHLLHTDAMPWNVFTTVKLNEDETTPSSRIFVKILVQEIAENLGIQKLKDRFENQDMRTEYSNMFPRDVPRNTR
tara:strand:+ start:171 stop:401 length:231 start_codon:yes stop_codon:yes gene_type:complete